MREVHKALASKPHPNDERPLPSPADDPAQLLAAVLAYRPQPQPRAWPRPRPAHLPHPRRRVPGVRGGVVVVRVHREWRT